MTPRAPGRGRRQGLFLVSAFVLLLCAPPAAADPSERDRDRDGGPRLSARAVLVLDNKTGKVLLSRNADQVRSIASLTKLQAEVVAPLLGDRASLSEGEWATITAKLAP